jgi:Ankyrin repeats (3 copies)
MSTRSLPPRPSLDELRLQAHELRRLHREGKRSAGARIAAHHPRMTGQPLEAILARRFSLADAQFVLAREYGFETWAALKHRVTVSSRVDRFKPHPRFDEAVAAIDAGDLEKLRALVAADPNLIHARTNLDPPYHYFTGATLLHHVAGNPARAPLPHNIVEIARFLLEAGADVHASTLGPNGGTTMGLVITSRQASEANVSGPLIELFLKHGAELDLERPAGVVLQWRERHVLDSPLANYAIRAAEKMIELGAKPDVCAVAALGRMDLLRDCFDEAGRLRWRARRGGKVMTERDAIGLAMLFAYVNRHPDAVDYLLEKDGNWNMIGVNNGTALHRAAWAGDLAMVQRLVAKGADTADRNNPFTSTPLSWAQHNKQYGVFNWFRTHTKIDLHDAVGFDLHDHVEARVREDPASINKRLDQWDIPQATPLHWSVWPTLHDVDGAHPHDMASRQRLVTFLLDHGADVNALAGNGLTPLDVAEAGENTVIATLLERHGAKRAAELD